LNDDLALVLMEVDAVAEVLERADEDVLEAVQAEFGQQEACRKEYYEEYRARKAARLPPPLAGLFAGKAGKKGRGRGSKDAGHPKLLATISHAAAALFLPPRSTVWMGLDERGVVRAAS
jgi:hypothetical protein